MSLEIVCFKWRPVHHYRSHFAPETVNTLRRMVARHYPYPHRFSCITDDATGIESDIRIIPLWDDYADVPNPCGRKNPSCYRRLKLFSREAAEIIGPRFVSLDLDCVITGDLSTLWNRDEDFVAYGDTHPRTYYNGSMLLLTAGSRTKVWDQFAPKLSPQRAKSAGHFGSDQAWISFCLGPGEKRWGRADGVYSYRNDIKRRNCDLPENARIVMFHGNQDPWGSHAQNLRWVKAHYH